MSVSMKIVLPVYYVSIEEELKRNAELKMSDLQMLKDWIDKQPHLPKIEMLYLVMFLHSNYYRIEPTKRTIDNFFTARTHIPEIFSNRDPLGWKELRKIFNVVTVIPLEHETPEGYIITFGKLVNPDPSQYDTCEAAKYLLMTCEIQNIMKGTSNGQIIVFDATGFSFGHLTRMSMNLMQLKKIMYYVQEAAPVRLKALHIINTVPAVDKVLNMMKPFVKKELLELLHFHSDLSTLEKYVPIKLLPNEYGGEAGLVQQLANKHITVIEEFRDWLKYDEHIGRVNESLRVNKCQAVDDLFGMDGSFKKLDID